MILKLICEAMIAGFEVVLIYYWAKAFSDGKAERWQAALAVSIIFILILIVSMLSFRPFVLITNTVLCTFSILYILNRQVKINLWLALCFVVIVAVSETIGGMFYAFIESVEFSVTRFDPLYRLRANIISELIAFAIIGIICARKHHSFYLPPFRIILQIVILPLTSILALVEMGLGQTGIYTIKNIVFNLSIIAGLALANVSVFFLFEREQLYTEQKQKEALYCQQLEYQKESYKNLTTSQKEVRKIRHDLKNTLTAVSGYLKAGEWERAETLLEETTSDLKRTEQAVYTGYPAVDAVLSAKASQMNQEDIPFSKTLVLPETLPISEQDLFILIGAILDNAIDASEKLAKEDRYVQLITGFDEHSFWIRIENAAMLTEGEQAGRLMTRKADKKSHGFGLITIRKIVEKYNGIWQIQPEKRKFTLNIEFFI